MTNIDKEWEKGFERLWEGRELEEFRRQKIKWFITQTLQASQDQLLTEVREAIGGLEKEQLDKNDPDNYGACYAIAGFNDGLAKSINLLDSYKKEI
jgi:hypothetical protein